MLQADTFAFIKVVETGSFTQAAEITGASKARVSQQISQLERRLGVTLLHRSTRSLRLTELGESYYSESVRAFNILQQIEHQLTEDSHTLSGTIKINSVGGIFAEQKLGPAVIAFMKQYPNISVQLEFSSSRIDIAAENYDLAVRMGKLENSTLVARTLTSLRSFTVASPAFIRKNGSPTQPKELTRYNCLCGSVKRWEFIHGQTGAAQEVSVSGALNIANGHILCEAALQGTGIVRIHELYLNHHIQTGDLIALLPDWEITPSAVSLIYPKVRYKVKRIQVFVDFLVAWFETKPMTDINTGHH